MLRITVELIPFGDETKKEVLDRIVIENKGESKNGAPYYDYKLFSSKFLKETEFGNVDRRMNVWMFLSVLLYKYFITGKKEHSSQDYFSYE